jgi:septum site-determining protein MinD
MGQALVVTSGKGGVGKTTISAALAIQLADKGHQIIAIDANFGLRNLDLVLGMGEEVVYDVGDVLDGTCDLNKALTLHPARANLRLLPGSHSGAPSNEQPEGLAEIVYEAKEQADYVIIDSPAGIGPGFRAAVRSADRALVVVTPDPTSLRDGGQVTGLLRDAGVADIRLIVNRVKPALRKYGYRFDIDRMIDSVGAQLIAILPDDDRIFISADRQAAFRGMEGSDFFCGIGNLTCRLQGAEVPLRRFWRRKRFFRFS